MQLSAGEKATKPLPADLQPANVSSVPAASAYNRRHGAFTGRVPANFSTTSIEPVAAVTTGSSSPSFAATIAAAARICLHARP